MTEKKVRMFPKLYRNEFGEGWILQMEQSGGEGAESLDYDMKIERKDELSPFVRYEISIARKEGR